MNEKAVKQLTKKGCIVEKDAAESLTEEDFQKIQQLDSTPMYITERMLNKLRTDAPVSNGAKPNGNSHKPNGVSNNGSKKNVKPNGSEPEPAVKKAVEEDSQKQKVKMTAGGETETAVENKGSDDKTGGNNSESKSSSDAPSAKAIKDRGSRDDLKTKVEVLQEAEITKDEKDVPEFLSYYNDRYDRMRKLLTRRMEMKSAVTINRLERRSEGEEGATIGLIKDKYSTSSGKWIVELEDKTGTFKALVDERDGERIVQDEVIGVRGNMGGDIIYANSVIRPDIPIPDGVNTTKEQVKAAYISDLHIGSKDTMENKLDRFAAWLDSEEARKIGYLVIPGDVVEGVGNYPGQEDELKVTDIYKQYERFEDWVEKLPDNLQIVVGPGNHDITRLAEPQPRLPEKVFPRIKDFNNVHLVQNPQRVRLHGVRSKGIRHLMYHGYSFDGQVDQIQALREKAYDDPHHVMIDLLKRRHLAPTYGTNLIAPGDRDHMVIEEVPDVMVSGHFHSHSNESYKGVNVICASSFQAQTDFQKRMGHEPQPGRVTIMDFKNRNTAVKKFV